MIEFFADLIARHPVFLFITLALGVSLAVAVHDGIEWLWDKGYLHRGLQTVLRWLRLIS